MRSIAFLVLLLSLFAGCARVPAKSAQEAMRMAAAPEVLQDDLGLQSLRAGIREHAEFLKTHGKADEKLIFGPRQISRDLYVKALFFLLDSTRDVSSIEAFATRVRENFDFYEIFGKKEWGEVFVTSYYDPVIEGSRQRSERFSRPVYAVPQDLVSVDMSSYADRFPDLEALKSEVVEQKSRAGILRGRLVQGGKDGGVAHVVPYYSRDEIDKGQKLAGRNLELAWLDPIDAFFLQIQGSGTVVFEDGGSLRLGYAAQNGYPYVAIGKFLKDVIPPEKMSLQAIDRYLRTLPPEKIQEMLNRNPSYVFFRKLPGRSVTSIGAEVMAGRTVATDQKYFPKGALAYLDIERPVFAHEQAVEPREWVPAPRFVFDQDTGGAIRGPDRLDLYWGQGRLAGQTAGVMKNWGRLYYLFPNERLLARLKAE